jgi:hypothetical protein
MSRQTDLLHVKPFEKNFNWKNTYKLFSSVLCVVSIMCFVLNPKPQLPKNHFLAHINKELNPKIIYGFQITSKLNSKLPHQQILIFPILLNHISRSFKLFQVYRT